MSIKRQPSVIVIGAGATGILAGIRLPARGIDDVVILEKSDRVGGTWRENTYPGVACDIPSHHYCYSFEPSPWSHQCALGPELMRYMEHVAQKYGVTPRIRFNQTVVSSVYNDATGRWTVTTHTGHSYEADFVIAATGILHHPKRPDIPGLNSFAGDMWHTAEWRHDIDLAGKRIGIIGTGSTSHQIVPELVKAGHETFVFQRTPQWVFPFPNLAFPNWLRRRWAAKPQRMRFWKWAYQTFMEQFFVKATIGRPVQNALLNATVKGYLWLTVRNRDLRKKLTPDYGVGCKRMVVNFTFLPAIQKPNAHLITEAIAGIEPQGVRLADGRLVALDVLILATGFYNFNFMRPGKVIGRAGYDIEQSWGDSRFPTYNAVLMEHFPNYFLMLGPGTPVCNNSVIGMAEVQMGYVERLIDLWRGGDVDAVEPKPDAVQAFGAYIRAGLGKSVWTKGCQSWYLDADGTPMVFPYSWAEFEALNARVTTADLTMERLAPQATSHIPHSPAQQVSHAV